MRAKKKAQHVWIIEIRDDETSGDGEFYPLREQRNVYSKASQQDDAAGIQLRHMASCTTRVVKYVRSAR